MMTTLGTLLAKIDDMRLQSTLTLACSGSMGSPTVAARSPQPHLLEIHIIIHTIYLYTYIHYL